MERKSKLLIFSLIVLIGGSIALLVFFREPTWEAPDAQLLQVPDLGTVDEITLYQSTDTVNLHFAQGKWLVNDRWKADPGMMKVLFATATQLRPRRGIDQLPETANLKATTVVYHSGGKELRRYKILGNSATQEAYASLQDATLVQVLIPGYKVYPGGIFELSATEWREKRVFDFNWRNFASLEVRYEDPAHDFKVILNERYFQLAGEVATDTTRLNDFLDAISYLNVQEFIPGSRALDSLATTKPVATYRVEDIAGKTFELKVFPSRTARIPVQLHGVEWAIIPGATLRKILLPRSYFVAGKASP